MNEQIEAVLNESGITISAGVKTIYNFRAETGEFTGSNKEFLPIGVGIPACSTLIPNPICEPGHVAIYDVGLQVWLVEEDHRGEVAYSIEDGKPTEISDIGPIPEGYTLLQPNTAANEWDGTKWIVNKQKAKELAVLEAEKKRESLLAVANTECNELMIDYNLGLLTEEQTEELKSWRIYIRELKVVVTENAPEIKWPKSPSDS
uniref:Tail fiber assembly protein n=1 Tax=feces metagenome TaxID=1861841 RepID=A0A7M2QM89_9ZZZZ